MVRVHYLNMHRPNTPYKNKSVIPDYVRLTGNNMHDALSYNTQQETLPGRALDKAVNKHSKHAT